MTDRVSIDDAGSVGRTVRRLGRLADDLADTATETATAVDHIAGVARSLAPRRSGSLARSIRPAGPGEVAATAAHAGPIERGVGPRPGLRGPHNIPAARYMAGAAERTAPAVLNTFTAAAETKLGKVAK